MKPAADLGIIFFSFCCRIPWLTAGRNQRITKGNSAMSAAKGFQRKVFPSTAKVSFNRKICQHRIQLDFCFFQFATTLCIRSVAISQWQIAKRTRLIFLEKIFHRCIINTTGARVICHLTLSVWFVRRLVGQPSVSLE